jgi:8-oxo-dGTP pyrophosphatase MutT (NUDIX family)
MQYPLRKQDVLGPLQSLLSSRTRRQIEDLGSSVAAAVLIALFEQNEDVWMWVLKRPETMRTHRGQVAFPGGKRDAKDATLLETALREAEEEIGLPRALCEPLGALDDLVTGTGFVITPHVVWLRASFEPVPNFAEVSKVFAVPLRPFTEPGAGKFPRMGHELEGELIWGATYVMARNLADLLKDAR